MPVHIPRVFRSRPTLGVDDLDGPDYWAAQDQCKEKVLLTMNAVADELLAKYSTQSCDDLKERWINLYGLQCALDGFASAWNKAIVLERYDLFDPECFLDARDLQQRIKQLDPKEDYIPATTYRHRCGYTGPSGAEVQSVTIPAYIPPVDARRSKYGYILSALQEMEEAERKKLRRGEKLKSVTYGQLCRYFRTLGETRLVTVKGKWNEIFNYGRTVHYTPQIPPPVLDYEYLKAHANFPFKPQRRR